MFIKDKTYSPSVFHKIIFTISLFVILFIGAITYKHVETISITSKLVMHTYKVNLELEHLFSHIKDSENSMRGFLISKDTMYLEPYRDATKKISSSFILLKKITGDNSKQQENLGNLFKIVNKRNNYVSNYSEQNMNIDIDTNTNFKKNFRESSRLLVSIRNEINKMIEIENSNLKTRTKAYEKQQVITPILALSILLTTLILIVFSYYKTTKDVEKLQIANNSLDKSQFLSYKAEILSEFGTWEWNLNTNQIEYSDNLYRILGYEPKSFPSSNDTFLTFVHPDDKEKVEEMMQQIVNNEDLPASFFRIKKPDGEIRHFKASGKLFIDELNNKKVLGITEDITDDFNKSLQLNERNKELEQNIKELSEFNHVASHDLQEPLRKIQTFISRLNDKEKENLSDFGKEYLTRIENASDRMRVLINDVLQYSRTSRTEKTLLKVDLNEIIENLKIELSQVIEDKKITITYNNLPIINAISFQMQQLFSNLISNSVKYARQDVAPIITIVSTEIIANEEAIIKDNSLLKYHKISVSDNGIGFDQVNSEKIFLLFNRLHGKTEYYGTGVGLAICKKIVENHNGFIFAQSSINKGATFTIYIPA